MCDERAQERQTQNTSIDRNTFGIKIKIKQNLQQDSNAETEQINLNT